MPIVIMSSQINYNIVPDTNVIYSQLYFLKRKVKAQPNSCKTVQKKGHMIFLKNNGVIAEKGM